jgi:hypothetical protein
LGLGTVNLVPSYTVFTEYMGETLTDEWFARISGNDTVPDLYIGRLPAATNAQAAVMVDKITTYETGANTNSWENNILLVADNQVKDWEAVFETMNQEALGLIPPAMNVPSEEYLGDYGAVGPLKTAIKDKINNDGALMVNYSGHGSIQIWANENIFNNNDVAGLTNDGMLPFFVAMTCLNGYFVVPEAFDFPSLAEVLLRSQDRGAVAAFMSTGMTEAAGQHIMDRALFNALFTEDTRALGPAISSAKQILLANGDRYEETSETFLLFGDPAMKLKIPLPRRPTGFLDANGNPVVGYNVYRSTTPSGVYTKLNSEPITGTTYTDGGLAYGNLFYYVVRSVDTNGDESVVSQEIGISTGSRTLGSPVPGNSSSGGGCFINTVLAR